MLTITTTDAPSGDGCGGGVGGRMVVLAAVGQQPERRGREKARVGASGVDGRVDRVTRKLFEAHRKTPPEKFFGGGDVVAGGGRVAGGGGGLPEFMGREKSMQGEDPPRTISPEIKFKNQPPLALE
ncbi:hypothetical protein Tco_0016645 [Tanacetum coccineum]